MINNPIKSKRFLICRYVNDEFESEYQTTIGVDFSLKTFHNKNGADLNVQLWDIAGKTFTLLDSNTVSESCLGVLSNSCGICSGQERFSGLSRVNIVIPSLNYCITSHFKFTFR